MSHFRRTRHPKFNRAAKEIAHDDRTSPQTPDGGAHKARPAGGDGRAYTVSQLHQFLDRQIANHPGYYQAASQGLTPYAAGQGHAQSLAAGYQLVQNQKGRLALQQAMLQYQLRAAILPYAASELEPDNETLPHEIVAGEIVGWRCWLQAHDGALHSMITDVVWPDGKMSGDVKDWGVHAWKTQEQARSYAICTPFKSEQYSRVVIGRVALWGQVVEHEEGYRAEHAEIMDIEEACTTETRAQKPSRFVYSTSNADAMAYRPFIPLRGVTASTAFTGNRGAERGHPLLIGALLSWYLVIAGILVQTIFGH